MALQKGGPGRGKIGVGYFAVCQVFSFQNKVISKKKVMTFN